MKTLTALGIATLALAAAAPAGAETNQTPPTDQNGKKSCEYAKWGGGTGHYPHGTSITVTLPTGASATVKCNDGTWEKTRRVPATTIRYSADSMTVARSGKLVMKNYKRIQRANAQQVSAAA